MAKLKMYSITDYYRGMELYVMCATTSKKKFSELTGISISHINNYAYVKDEIKPMLAENPDTLFAEPGMGGEITYITIRGEIKPYQEYEGIIDKHREKYKTYRDFLEEIHQ